MNDYVRSLASDIVDLSLLGNLHPDWILAQMCHESDGFTSELAIRYRNFTGLTQVQCNELPQPDGDYYYMIFNTPSLFVEYYAKYLNMLDGIDSVNSLESFVTCLNFNGYFGVSYDEYLSGCQSWLAIIR